MASRTYEFTQNMKELFREKTYSLGSYYCREDMDLLLKDLKKAAKDEVPFIKKQIFDICEARNIDAEEIINNPSAIENIPTRSEVKNYLLQSFYDMYSNAPSTSLFMERLVCRLAPEYSSDTVRTAILKKFIAGTGENFKTFNVKSFIEYAENRFSEEERKEYKGLPEEGKLQLVLSKIDDSVFCYEKCDADLNDRDVAAVLLKNIKRFKEENVLDFGKDSLSEKSAILFDKTMKEYGIEEVEDFSEQIQKVTDVLSEGNKESFSSLLESVENDYKKALKSAFVINKKGEPMAAYGVYIQAKKDAKKAKRKAFRTEELDYGLLELCNDLASGSFRVNGFTKKYLYYFAFIFGMTVSFGDKKFDEEKDVEKNLFQDYYNDNLLRLLSKEYENSALEKMPTGEGINYKNFAEVIYLYWLYHDELPMSPGEKIDMAEETISRCVNLCSGSEIKQKKIGIYTEEYRDNYVLVLMNKKPEEISNYIAKHFVIDEKDSYWITAASEENTAYDLIHEIANDIEAEYPETDPFLLYEIDKKDDFKKKVEEEIAFKKNKYEFKVAGLLKKEFCSDEKFIKVVEAIEKRTSKQDEFLSGKEIITALTLLSVLYNDSSKEKPISDHLLRKAMHNKGVAIVGYDLSKAFKILEELGFDVEKTEKQEYSLGERNYESPFLNNILGKVSSKYYFAKDEDAMLVLEKYIEMKDSKKRIRRTDLITLHFNFYIALLNETEGLTSFPDVFEDYVSTINPLLEQSRFQPISEKNIFDMYIITELYFYLLENNGYL